MKFVNVFNHEYENVLASSWAVIKYGIQMKIVAYVTMIELNKSLHQTWKWACQWDMYFDCNRNLCKITKRAIVRLAYFTAHFYIAAMIGESDATNKAWLSYLKSVYHVCPSYITCVWDSKNAHTSAFGNWNIFTYHFGLK